MPVKTYLPDEVKISFMGEPLTGFADGEFVVVSPNAQRFNKGVGADGEVLRSRSNDFTHTVQITFMQSSASNDFLSAMAELDRLSAGGKGPLSITDLSGTTLHLWPEAWLQQEADTSRGKESTDTVWTFDTGQVTPGANIVGGNNE